MKLKTILVIAIVILGLSILATLLEIITSGAYKTAAENRIFDLVYFFSVSLKTVPILIFVYLLNSNQNKIISNYNKSVDVEAILVPIRGWLILPAIGLIVNTLIILFSILKTLELIGNSSMDILKVILIFDSVLFLYLLYVIYVFFSRSSKAPKAYSLLLCLSVVFNLIVLMVSFDGDHYGLKNVYQMSLLKSVIIACIWVPYFNMSKRVKQTFVND